MLEQSLAQKRGAITAGAWGLALAVLLGFFHGLIYLYLIPPWQHYDEPNHFEYVWLVAYRNRLPEPGERDPALNRGILESMVAHGFFDRMGFQPDLSAPDDSISIGGYSQLDEPPLYYLLAAAPVRIFKPGSLVHQLYASRFTSLALYLLTVFIAWGLAGELVGVNNPLRWIAPLALALLPGFADLMTAVNNDVGAVAFFSLFLWGCVRMIKQGLRPANVLWSVGAAALCFFTKSTVLIALVLLPLAALLGVLRGKWIGIGCGVIALGLILALFGIIHKQDAAGWYRSTSQENPTRFENPQAVLGKYVIALDTTAANTPVWMVPLFQPLSLEQGQALSGRPVTLGAWMWASQPVSVQTPILNNENQRFSQTISIGQEPVFYALQATLSSSPGRVWVSLDPRPSPSEAQATVFFDGLVLAEGHHPVEQSPRFLDPGGEKGVWGGRPFDNLLINASAESRGFGVVPRIDTLGAAYLPDHSRPSLIMNSLLDWPRSGWLYHNSTISLLRTFWGKFGWGHVPLIGPPRPYRILAALSLVGVLGALWGVWRRRSRIHPGLLLFLVIAIGFIWAAALIRSPIYLAIPHVYLPVARYTYPVIIPVIFLLTLGWMESLKLLWTAFVKLRLVPQVSQYPAVSIFLFFTGLDILAVISISRYYGF